jgi:phosphoribosyl-AMP cyclohydrolase
MPDRAATTYPAAAIEAMLAEVRFDPQGLVPAIAQQHDTGEVLMMAWMDRNAVVETMQTGRACYWSRSRKAPWRKGDTSGHIQIVVDFRVDCDGDTVLMLVDQTGVACHTGRHNCFFRAIRGGKLEEIAPVQIDMGQIDMTKIGKD